MVLEGSSQRDVEEEWREKQKVKESRCQSGQKGIGFGDTSGNDPEGKGTGIQGVRWRRSRNPGTQGRDFVLPSRNSSFPSYIPNKNLISAAPDSSQPSQIHSGLPFPSS